MMEVDPVTTQPNDEMNATQVRRGTRERKQDVKMNVGELGETGHAKKKRTALKDIDGNCGKKPKNDEKKAEEELPAGCEMEGDWMFVKVSSPAIRQGLMIVMRYDLQNASVRG